MADVSALHDELLGPMLDALFNPLLAAGGDVADVLVLLESVCAGVLAIAIKPEGADAALATFQENVRRRLAILRLENAEPAGSG